MWLSVVLEPDTQPQNLVLGQPGSTGTDVLGLSAGHLAREATLKSPDQVEMRGDGWPMNLGLSEKGSLASLGQGGWAGRGSKNRPVSFFLWFLVLIVENMQSLFP